MDGYRSKSGIVERLGGVVDRMAAAGVSPDAVTLAAVPVSIAGGLALLASTSVPLLLLVVPVAAAARLVLNLVDGALARATGRSHPRGEVFNEVGDRLSDIALMAPVAFVPGSQRETVLLGVTFALLASFVGVVTKTAGGDRLYRGVLSKPGRMALLAVFAVLALVLGPQAWGPFGPILLVGTALTTAERLVVGVRSVP